VILTAGQVLAASPGPVNYGYFITNGMVCLLTVMKNGMTTADHLVGREGFVGLPLLLGNVNPQPGTVVVQIPGRAMRIDAAAFLEEFNKPGLFQNVMRRYGLARMVGITQTAACNTLHCIQERMACWLLLTADRVGIDVPVTHDAIAQMLGSRRATVSVHAEKLQRMGLITYGYKLIHIQDRNGLEKVACECYQIHRRTMDSVFRF
jgi:CRP-like cAMP-binding protein